MDEIITVGAAVVIVLLLLMFIFWLRTRACPTRITRLLLRSEATPMGWFMF